MLLGGVAVGLFVALDGDDDEPGGPPETTTTEAPVTETGQELLDRLERGRELDLHIRYDADPAEVEAAGTKLTMELWRSGDRVRQDILLEGPGVRTELAAFQLPDGNFICQRTSEADWSCDAARSTATEAGEPAGLVEAAAAELAGADVVATDETIADVEARCYAIDGDATSSTLCVTEDGVPVRLAVQGQQLTAGLVERDVDGAVFELPAEPVDPA